MYPPNHPKTLIGPPHLFRSQSIVSTSGRIFPLHLSVGYQSPSTNAALVEFTVSAAHYLEGWIGGGA